MLERILTALNQAGWLTQVLPNGWLGAWEPLNERGMALLTLSPGETLPPLVVPQDARVGDVLVFCPGGVDSALLRQVDGIHQYWFWDLRTGEIFPYPQANSQPMRHWLEGSLQGEVRSLAERKASRGHIPIFTYTFLVLNVLVFLLMEIAGGSTHTDVLIAFGAKVNLLIQQGEVWRLLTANFIHIGLMHLAFNLYALWFLGPFAEELFGHGRFLVLYLVSGVGGTLSSFLLSPALSAGASAAIFGLLGALILYSWRHPQLWRSGLGMNLVVVTAVNLVFGMIQPGIDNYAHLGGLVCGAVITALGEIKTI